MPSIEANGVSIEYETLGDPSNPSILLVMGRGANMRLWPSAFCEKLAGAGFHVVRMDNRDAGRSTQLDFLGTPNIPKEAIKYLLRLPIQPCMPADMLPCADVPMADVPLVWLIDVRVFCQRMADHRRDLLYCDREVVCFGGSKDGE